MEKQLQHQQVFGRAAGWKGLQARKEGGLDWADGFAEKVGMNFRWIEWLVYRMDGSIHDDERGEAALEQGSHVAPHELCDEVDQHQAQSFRTRTLIWKEVLDVIQCVKLLIGRMKCGLRTGKLRVLAATDTVEVVVEVKVVEGCIAINDEFDNSLLSSSDFLRCLRQIWQTRNIIIPPGLVLRKFPFAI
jgi:hypothetical protein